RLYYYAPFAFTYPSYPFSCRLRYPHPFPTRRSSDLVTRKCSRRIRSRGACARCWRRPRRRPNVTMKRSLSITKLSSWRRRSQDRSEEHTSELRHGSISYAVFCLKKKTETTPIRCTSI